MTTTLRFLPLAALASMFAVTTYVGAGCGGSSSSSSTENGEAQRPAVNPRRKVALAGSATPRGGSGASAGTTTTTTGTGSSSGTRLDERDKLDERDSLVERMHLHRKHFELQQRRKYERSKQQQWNLIDQLGRRRRALAGLRKACGRGWLRSLGKHGPRPVEPRLRHVRHHAV